MFWELHGVLHKLILQDPISGENEIPGCILKTFFDINSPAGAIFFCCLIGGTFLVFIAILDSLKPQNFPPGPRWLPFRGDISNLCEKRVKFKETSRLQSEFGSVVGLRQNDSSRDPLILIFDSALAENVDIALQSGYLQQSKTCEENFTKVIETPSLVSKQLFTIVSSKETENYIDYAAKKSVEDLLQILEDYSGQITSSTLISLTVLAVFLNVITGKRVLPNSPHLTRLHKILVNNFSHESVLNENLWTEYSDVAGFASTYSTLIMALDDLEETELFYLRSSHNSNILSFHQNSTSMNNSERITIIADLLLKSNIGYYCSIINKALSTIVSLKGGQKGKCHSDCADPSEGFVFKTKDKLKCEEYCTIFLSYITSTVPVIRIGKRWRVVKSFYLSGFIIPQGSNLQTIVGGKGTHSSLEKYSSSYLYKTEKIDCPVQRIMMILLSRLLSEILLKVKIKDLHKVSIASLKA